MAFVVFLFTSALFLSGYVLQQQTVRDLRAAIQPKPTPQAARLYLPTQFAVQPAASPKANALVGSEGNGEEIEVTREPAEALGVKQSNEDTIKGTSPSTDPALAKEAVEGTRLRKIGRPSEPDFGSLDLVAVQKPISLDEERFLGQAKSPEENSPLSSNGQPNEKPMSRAERRRKIKEEIMGAGDGEGFKGYKRRQY